MKRLLALACVAISLSACGVKQDLPGFDPAASGAQVQQPRSGVDGSSALLGGALGFMAGRMTAPSPVQHSSTVVHKTVVVQRPAYTPPQPAYRPAHRSSYTSTSRSFGRR